MSRRKKRPGEAVPGHGGAVPRSEAAVERPAGPTPHPPRPHRLFLAVTGVLLAAWIAFLVVLAART